MQILNVPILNPLSDFVNKPILESLKKQFRNKIAIGNV